MSETLYRYPHKDTHPPTAWAQRAWERLVRTGNAVPVEPERIIEGRVVRSEPIDKGLHGFRITIVSDRPVNSLTMHGKVLLVGVDDE